MNRLFLPVLLAVVLAPAWVRAQDLITIETKFIETNVGVTPPLDDAALARMTGIDLLSAPRVTTKSDQRAKVEITHDAALPAGDIAAPEPVQTGVSLDVVPRLQGEEIVYRIHLTKAEVVRAGTTAATLETVTRDLYAAGTAKSGEPVWLQFTPPAKGRQVLVQVKFTRGAF